MEYIIIGIMFLVMLLMFFCDIGKLEAGQRVCQFRIFRNQPDLIFLPVKHLGNENRGGYGSTGK